MRSSPSLNEDDEMFPDEALPQTPAIANTTTVTELSPPNSQSQPRDPTTNLTLGVNANGKRPLSLAQTAAAGVVGTGTTGSVHQDAETGYQWSKQEDQPGYEWKNTRAREEEARALESIVDKGLQIKSMYGLLRWRTGLMIWDSSIWRSFGPECACEGEAMNELETIVETMSSFYDDGLSPISGCCWGKL
jgi:hypothetical protein